MPLKLTSYKTIQKLHSLLTTNEWINEYNAKLAKSQAERSLKQSREKAPLQERIYTNSKSLESILTSLEECGYKSRIDKPYYSIPLTNISEEQKRLEDITSEISNIKSWEKELGALSPKQMMIINKAKKQLVSLSSTIKNLEHEIKAPIELNTEATLAICDATHLTKEEAQILLANMQLFSTEGVNPLSADKLKELFRAEFDQLNSSEVVNLANEVSIPNTLYINRDDTFKINEIGNILFPQCQMIASMYTSNGGLNANEMASKLGVWFENVHDAENYLKTVNYENKETVELSFGYPIPDIGKIPQDQLKFWHDVNKTLGREGIHLFAHAENVISKKIT